MASCLSCAETALVCRQGGIALDENCSSASFSISGHRVSGSQGGLHGGASGCRSQTVQRHMIMHTQWCGNKVTALLCHPHYCSLCQPLPIVDSECVTQCRMTHLGLSLRLFLMVQQPGPNGHMEQVTIFRYQRRCVGSEHIETREMEATERYLISRF